MSSDRPLPFPAPSSAFSQKRSPINPAAGERPAWFEDAHHLWLPYAQMKTTPQPLAASRTAGSLITLSDGRELIDGIASWWTACHGYNHPHIRAAVSAQLEEMPHVMLGGLVHEPAATLARRLAALLPEDLNRVFFTESGSVSVEVAMKVAVQYFRNRGEPERNHFVSFLGGYHGDTFMTMAIADPEEGMHHLFRPVLRQEQVVSLPRTPAELSAFSDFLCADKSLAAVVIEPLVQGAGGMVFFDADVLRGIRAACDAAGLLLIADEIFVAFGRTGHMFACESAGVVPDILTLSKALTGGTLPLAATVVRESIFEAFWSDANSDALMHGPTYMGNALACAAANASLDLFESEPRLQQAETIGRRLTEGLASLADLPGVNEVRVRGAIGVIQLKEASDWRPWKQRFVEEGVWVRPFRDIVYVTPALTISDEELSRLMAALVKVTEELA